MIGDGAVRALTAQRALELLRYEPESGLLFWLVRPCQRIPAGTAAGGMNAEGYRTVRIDGRSYLAHRVVWLLQTGDWPQHDIDHINGDRADNRWGNLRDVSRAINNRNRVVASSRNSTGLLGVTVGRYGFYADIGIDGKQVHLGHFKTAEEAHQAYLSAKANIHPEARRV